jgi:hypothetical protein
VEEKEEVPLFMEAIGDGSKGVCSSAIELEDKGAGERMIEGFLWVLLFSVRNIGVGVAVEGALVVVIQVK